jgi:hypothetical protein
LKLISSPSSSSSEERPLYLVVKEVLVREIPRVAGTATFVSIRNGPPCDPDRGIVVIDLDLVVVMVVGLVVNNDSTCPNRDNVSSRSTATGTSSGTGSRRIVVFLGRPTLEWVVRVVEVEVQEPLGTMVMEMSTVPLFVALSSSYR